MTRIIGVALSLVILVSLFFVYPSHSTVTHAQDDGKTLTVVWMSSPSDSEAQRELIERFAADFEAANPEVMVNLILVDWSEGRQYILDSVEGGTPPDIAMIGARWVPEFVSEGLIEPLDRFITDDFRSQFVESIINEGAVYQGRTFGLPIATSTRALYYNLELFEAAGIETPPTTWDELLEAGKAINALEGDDVFGFGLQGGDGLETNTYFYYFVWGNGGDLYNTSRTESALNSPEAIEALQFLQRMIEEEATQPNIETYERRRLLEDDFQAGKLGMMISGPWFINRLRNEAPDLRFGIAPIPYNTTPSTYGVMDAIVILRTSRNKALAWEYLESLYTINNRLEYALTAGVLPEMKAVVEAPEFVNDPDYAVFLSLLPDARFEPLHIRSEEISQTVIEAVRAVYMQEADVEAALNDATEEINTLLGTAVIGW